MSLSKKWRRLPEKEKNLTLALIMLLLITGYAFAVYAPSSEKMQWTENMVNRQKNRKEVKQSEQITDLPDIGGLEQKLSRLSTLTDTARRELDRYESRQAPSDDPIVIQELQIDINALALAAGIDVLSVKNAGVSLDGEQAPDTEEVLQTQTRNLFGRPQIQMKAKGSFGALMTFLSSLPDLSYQVSVSRIGLQAPTKNIPAYGSENFQISPVSTLNLDLLITL
ncbi:MAG: hypothetical protein AAF402_07620 [Pseudomonadota bacterium]